MVNDDSLQQLDDLLLSITPEDDGMLASEFDGFCAGLIVCPEVILPSEWLPCIWGDGDEIFDSPQAAQSTTDLIMKHYNDVAVSLTPPVIDYATVFDEDTRTGELIWELWACGFERAMTLRPDAWEQVVETADDDTATALMAMIALCDVAQGRSKLRKLEIKSLTRDAADMIPELVVALNDWTKSRTAQGTLPPFLRTSGRPQTPFLDRKVGRNEPCPCGSGRKYKRCCGAV